MKHGAYGIERPMRMAEIVNSGLSNIYSIPNSEYRKQYPIFEEIDGLMLLEIVAPDERQSVPEPWDRVAVGLHLRSRTLGG
jgi:hypothetical protein